MAENPSSPSNINTANAVNDDNEHDDVAETVEVTNDNAEGDRDSNRSQVSLLSNGGARDSNRNQGFPNDDDSNGSRDHRKRALEGDLPDEDPMMAASPAKKGSFGCKSLIREADKGKWALPQELADHFNLYTRTHMSDSDMSMNMADFHVPSNVSGVLEMDYNFKTVLKNEKPSKNAAIDADNDFENIQRCMMGVMGPLGKAWNDCALYKRGDSHKLDAWELTETLEAAAVSVAHAI